jgi:Fe-S-cluster containining protein
MAEIDRTDGNSTMHSFAPEQEEPSSAAWALQLSNSIARSMSERLSKYASLTQLKASVESALRIVDQNIVAITDDIAKSSEADARVRPVACRAGCAYCCYARVSVLPSEALNIASFIATEFKQDAQKAVLERIRSYSDVLSTLPVEGRMSNVMQCPFLLDNRCSIYEVRPLPCRMHHSMSVDACRENFSDHEKPIPMVAEFSEATMPVVDGLNKGAQQAGKRSQDLEFIPALRIAMETEDAAERWLSGEDVFASSHDEELSQYTITYQRDLAERRSKES